MKIFKMLVTTALLFTTTKDFHWSLLRYILYATREFRVTKWANPLTPFLNKRSHLWHDKAQNYGKSLRQFLLTDPTSIYQLNASNTLFRKCNIFGLFNILGFWQSTHKRLWQPCKVKEKLWGIYPWFMFIQTPFVFSKPLCNQAKNSSSPFAISA